MVTEFRFVQPFINFIKRDKVFHTLKHTVSIVQNKVFQSMKQSVSSNETLYDKGLYIRVNGNNL